VKILSTADWHLGSGVTLTPNRLEEQMAMVDWIADYACSEQVDVVAFAGDAFHRRRPTPTELSIWQAFLVRMAEAHVGVVAVPGNHDVSSPDNPSALNPVTWPFAEVWLSSGPVIVPTRGVVFGLLPWTHPGVVRQSSPNAVDAARTVGEHLGDIAQMLALQAAQGHPHCPRVLILHWSVGGAYTPTGMAVEQFAAEPVMNLADLRAQGWDAVVCGHIHKAQGLAGGKHHPVFYTGSPWAVDWGEAGDFHGVAVLDVGPGGVTGFEWVAVPDHRFVTLDIDYTANGDAPATPAVGTGDVVRVRYRSREDAQVPPGEVRALMESQGALVAMVQPEVVRVERARAEIDESVAPMEALSEWLRVSEQPPEVASAVAEQTMRYLEDL
jgi:exonuclease SbcD